MCLLVTNVFDNFQNGHHVIRRSDRYWSVPSTDRIFREVLMGEMLRVDGG